MMSICDLQEIWALHIWLADLGERSAGWLGDGEIYVHYPPLATPLSTPNSNPHASIVNSNAKPAIVEMKSTCTFPSHT